MAGRPPRLYRYLNREISLGDLAVLCGVKKSTLRYRIEKLGLKPEIAARRRLEKK